MGWQCSVYRLLMCSIVSYWSGGHVCPAVSQNTIKGDRGYTIMEELFVWRLLARNYEAILYRVSYCRLLFYINQWLVSVKLLKVLNSSTFLSSFNTLTLLYPMLILGQCGPPPTVTNGVSDSTPATSNEGDEIVYTCSEGYEFSSEDSTTFTATCTGGSWPTIVGCDRKSLRTRPHSTSLCTCPMSSHFLHAPTPSTFLHAIAPSLFLNTIAPSLCAHHPTISLSTCHPTISLSTRHPTISHPHFSSVLPFYSRQLRCPLGGDWRTHTGQSVHVWH